MKKMERGVTLIELLAALVITGFVVFQASRIFLSGNRQFIERTFESNRLRELYRLKTWVQGALKDDIQRCNGGRLWLNKSSWKNELKALAMERFPHLIFADFRCMEVSSDSNSLVQWDGGFQPALVEYLLVVGKGSEADTLQGSWIK